MADLFKEVVPSILQNKKNVLLVEQDEKDYLPYIVNRALSQHMDAILYANEMNKFPNIDNKLQYQYLLNSIRSMKRKFQPWNKLVADEDLNCVKEFFGYSNEKVKQALRILTTEQIAEIRRITDKGGVKK